MRLARSHAIKLTAAAAVVIFGEMAFLGSTFAQPEEASEPPVARVLRNLDMNDPWQRTPPSTQGRRGLDTSDPWHVSMAARIGRAERHPRRSIDARDPWGPQAGDDPSSAQASLPSVPRVRHARAIDVTDPWSTLPRRTIDATNPWPSQPSEPEIPASVEVIKHAPRPIDTDIPY